MHQERGGSEIEPGGTEMQHARERWALEWEGDAVRYFVGAQQLVG
jgi:hypothetical protein